MYYTNMVVLITKQRPTERVLCSMRLWLLCVRVFMNPPPRNTHMKPIRAYAESIQKYTCNICDVVYTTPAMCWLVADADSQ